MRVFSHVISKLSWQISELCLAKIFGPHLGHTLDKFNLTLKTASNALNQVRCQCPHRNVVLIATPRPPSKQTNPSN